MPGTALEWYTSYLEACLHRILYWPARPDFCLAVATGRAGT